MKLYLEPITVELSHGTPQRVHWRRRTFVVREMIDFWVSQGRWWSSEERRVYMRLLTDGGMLEIYRSRDAWWLSRVFD